MATDSHPPQLDQEEAKESLYLDLDENTCDDHVEVNIAIVGKAGCGRSSFVYSMLGLKRDETISEPSEDCEETTPESEGEVPNPSAQPKNPTINFSIFTRKDQETVDAFTDYLESIETERFDAFLIFTADEFTNEDVLIARKIALDKKPFFLVRTKFDNHYQPEDFDKEAMLTELRASLDEHSKVFDCSKSEIHLISNLHPYQWDFLKLAKAITDALLPPQKLSFARIAKVQEVINLKKFQNFVQEVETEQRYVTKILPNIDKIQTFFEEGGILGVQRAMNEKLNRWKEVEINLAILGNSGAGKSCFINAIRGVADGDKKSAAPTGITETTRIPAPFKYPASPNIRFWDLPGIGTPNYPDLETFCREVAIETYDTFIIICSKRFTNYDLLLAEKVQSMGKSFFFVRTKIDEDMRSESRKNSKDFNEENTLKMVRKDCIENLQGSNFDAEKIFLISSYETERWDFDRLQKAIIDHLPSKQKESLILSMRSRSRNMVSEKIETLRSRIWMVAAISIVSKFTLGLFSLLVDGILIKDKVKFYSRQMEFPPSDSEEFAMLSDDLQRRVKKFDLSPGQDICEWLKSFDVDNTLNLKKCGKLIISKNPLMVVHRLLNLILDEMEETTLSIFCEAVVKKPDDN